MKKAAFLLIGAVAIACASVAPGGAEGADPVFQRNDPAVRIALGTSATPVALTASSDWRIYNRARDSYLMTGKAGEIINIETAAGRMRSVRANGKSSDRLAGPFL